MRFQIRQNLVGFENPGPLDQVRNIGSALKILLKSPWRSHESGVKQGLRGSRGI
jgi:hypothetical protein